LIKHLLALFITLYNQFLILKLIIMKAIGYNSYGGIDKLQILEVESPKPKRHEVAVKVSAISINPVDLKKMRGGFKPITSIKKFPIITACDFSGEIVEIGNDVGAFKVGDKVFGMQDILFNGSAAEKITISQKYISLAPNNFELSDSAAIPQVGNTSLLALRNIASLRKGHKLLINGASGGVGTFALQMAKIYEADITAVTSDRNIEWIKNEFDIENIIDYTKTDITDTSDKYDIIFDANGNLSFPKISNSLSANGIYVTTKFNIYNNIDTAKQFFKRKKSRTVLSGRTSTSNLDMFRMWMEDGKLKPVIEKTYSFDQYHEAYEHLSSGRAKGKLLIKIN
tara:strand:- start:341 stop:1360 length:1020 start_codon:yes stop_codon:yes gene_type:complete